MNAALLALFGLLSFVLGHRFYGRYLDHKVFQLSDEDSKSPTPAVALEDGIDYVPTKKTILLGHHFSSIAGAAPIVGPAVAVIWGWLPAFLWIVFGVIFVGAVHDYGSLVISMKHKGQSIGQIAEQVLGPKAGQLFLIVIFFLVWMVIAVFTLVIANLFISYPSSVIPINFEILIALGMGLLINKRGQSLKLPSLAAQLGLLIMIYVGTLYPLSLHPLFGEYELMAWIVFLLLYSFIASILPVWILLQPRDYINSHQLFLGLGLMLLGLFIGQPPVVAPAINLHPVDAPPLFPFIFITIACGAISGFHGLVSSGTTSKQVQYWKDAKPIGHGSMLGEGLLALLATLAVATGFKTSEAWHQHYASWGHANGLSAKINAFVQGAGQFIASLGLSESFAQTVIVVLIISFAATSLDTACRIQRYILREFGESFQIPTLKNRYFGSALAVGSAFILMLTKGGGKGGLHLWPLFGATNQMLAALSFIVLAVYLYRNGRPALSYALPAVLVIILTTVGLSLNLKNYFQSKHWMLFCIGSVLLMAQIWIFMTGIRLIREIKRG